MMAERSVIADPGMMQMFHVAPTNYAGRAQEQ